MLPDTDSLILFWSVARAQHQQHRMTTSWSAGGKARLPRSFWASVRGRSIRVERAQPVPGGRRAHRIGRTRMTPWSRRTAHSSRRTASASRCGNLLQARLRAYWGL
jgi:hypothetical protein